MMSYLAWRCYYFDLVKIVTVFVYHICNELLFCPAASDLQQGLVS